jgi:hypothetical protein
MLIGWPVQEFIVRENWNFSSVETLEARSPEAQRDEVVGKYGVT